MAPKTKEKTETPASTYELGDTVLGKIRGYPPWPGQVVDPENVPKNVTKERPAGKKAKFYCVRFLPTGEYGWIAPKDMSRLQKHEIEAYVSEPSKKSGDLLKGYKAALDPAAVWEKLEAGIQEAEEAEVDQLESEGEDGPKPKAKKRKRDNDAAEKPTKSRAKKEPVEKKKAAPRAKSNKSKDTVESEDDAGDDKPAAKKTKTVDDSSEQVKSWRHKLQKCFLNKDKVIKPDDMEDMDKTFTAIEAFNMSVDNLSYSKIGKVMRHIAKLEVSAIPDEDKYNFRDRASSLVDTWGKFTGRPSKGSANGDAKDEEEEANGKANEDAGDLTMMDTDVKDANADADGEADAEAEAETEVAPTKEDANGDAEMADA